MEHYCLGLFSLVFTLSKIVAPDLFLVFVCPLHISHSLFSISLSQFVLGDSLGHPIQMNFYNDRNGSVFILISELVPSWFLKSSYFHLSSIPKYMIILFI